MDAMDVLTNLEHLHPYFQPIFSADEHVVIGYEILGRYVNDSGTIDTASYMQDEQIPEEYRFEVNHYLLQLALSKISTNSEKFFIFIPLEADLLMLDHGESFLEMLKKYVGEEKLSRVVVEFSENGFKGDFDSLHHYLSSIFAATMSQLTLPQRCVVVSEPGTASVTTYPAALVQAQLPGSAMLPLPALPVQYATNTVRSEGSAP